MDAAEKRELQSSLKAMLAEAAEGPSAIADQLRELGWDDVVAEEPAAAALLFEELGRAGVASALLDQVVVSALGVEETAAVAYPLHVDAHVWAPAADRRDSTATVDAVLRIAGNVPEQVLLPVGEGEMKLVPTSALDVRPVVGLDERGGWHRIQGTVDIDPSWSVEVDGSWQEAVTVARRLLAAELVGLARAALDLATGHVTERHQFGRPIGTFQAVRFRLAESKVAVEAAAEAIRFAFEDGSSVSAAVAKVLAGNAAESAVRNAGQVCGAMGMTWEFGLHGIIRRSFALDQLLGSAAALTSALGRYVAETVDRPLLDPLVVPIER